MVQDLKIGQPQEGVFVIAVILTMGARTYWSPARTSSMGLMVPSAAPEAPPARMTLRGTAWRVRSLPGRGPAQDGRTPP